MPRKPNTTFRLAVTSLLVLVAIGVTIAVAVNSANQTRGPQTIAQNRPVDADADTAATTPEATPETAPETAPTPPPAVPPTDADPDAAPTSAADAALAGAADAATDAADQAADAIADALPDSVMNAGTEDAVALLSLRARVLADPDAPLTPLGALDDGSDFQGSLEFSPRGAGLASLRLTHYFDTIAREEHVLLQSERFIDLPDGGRRYAVPFALLGVMVNDAFVATAAPGTWQQHADDPGHFEAVIENALGDPVVRLERTFEYAPGSFDLELRQTATNLSGQDLAIRWVQTGVADLPKPTSAYGGDKRRIRYGYFLNPQSQAGSPTVVADDQLRSRTKIIGSRDDFGAYAGEAPLWPIGDSARRGNRLAWAAFTNRYFGVAVHGLFDPAAAAADPTVKLLEGRVALDRLVLNPYAEINDTVAVMRMTTAAETVAPGGASGFDLGVYAGPLLKPQITADPIAASLNLEGLVSYNHGGWFSWCTFSPLTGALVDLLMFFSRLTGDWGVGIILLVILVRTLLHPITRWSQIRVRRFGVQMQNAQPNMKKVQERYKPKDTDSPEERKRKQQKQQQEMARLWQEEGINPANALGCLPMLLQTPVWTALWASLYFAAELRHEPAFWGVFQQISGGDWKFLADLASPDRAVPLGPLSFKPPFIGNLYGTIESINLLPILMAVLFFFHQKILTPTSTASLSPEQEQMQKTMRIMFPLMMPLFMYTAPSGLTIYFITNSTLAIIENKWIIHTAEKQGLLDADKIKAEKLAKKEKKGTAGKPGFFERLRIAAEEQQRQRAQGAAGGGAGGAGSAAAKRYVQNTAPPKKDLPKRYKKRGG